MSKSINPNIKRKKRAPSSIENMIHALPTADRYLLSDILTIVESTSEKDRDYSSKILSTISEADSEGTLRIGITGSPGAGKSSMIERLGLHFISKGHKVAVLAVDPSSTRTEGSILGDKTRMPQLSAHPDAYIRPTASATHLGGVSKTTRAAIALCEKANYDVIIVESVGVGQSEVELSSLVDVNVLLLLPGGGDDVQGIKRGIVEMADILMINKADGERKSLALQSKKDYQGSVRLFTHPLQGWIPTVSLSSTTENIGIDTLYDQISKFVSLGKEVGYFHSKRKEQNAHYVKSQVVQRIMDIIEKDMMDTTLLEKINSLTPTDSIFQLTQSILSQIEKKLT